MERPISWESSSDGELDLPGYPYPSQSPQRERSVRDTRTAEVCPSKYPTKDVVDKVRVLLDAALLPKPGGAFYAATFFGEPYIGWYTEKDFGGVDGVHVSPYSYVEVTYKSVKYYAAMSMSHGHECDWLLYALTGKARKGLVIFFPSDETREAAKRKQ